MIPDSQSRHRDMLRVCFCGLTSSNTENFQYLLNLIYAFERCHFTVLVRAEHLAHGAGRDAAGQAVDVDLLILMHLTHGLVIAPLWSGSAAVEHHRGTY